MKSDNSPRLSIDDARGLAAGADAVLAAGGDADLASAGDVPCSLFNSPRLLNLFCKFSSSAWRSLLA